MVASENGALSGGKVGGVGDVLKNLPEALASLGWNVTVIIPSYGFLHRENRSRLSARVRFPFGGKIRRGEIWSVQTKSAKGVTQLLFDHDDIGGEPIYFNDPPRTPFSRDSTKYAMFCSAVGQYLKAIPRGFVLHLHDWHAATIVLLQELHSGFSELRDIQTAFTIHNLALQGTRPMRHHPSSLEAWFPELFTTSGWISVWKDPRYAEPCYTPMAAGIRFADRVNTVSPTYAAEILEPSNHSRGLYRGEGLERYLRNASTGKRLFGILNGCEYPAERESNLLNPRSLLTLMVEVTSSWKQGDALCETMDNRLRQLMEKPPVLILTSITRAVEQKVRLLFEKGSDGKRAIEHICRLLAKHDGLYVFLGTGTKEYEGLLTEAARRNKNFIFLKGYSEPLARALYASGDLFLMPSLFEPCGISQMIAMREGQPCVVHAVGGLRDTVIDGKNGFAFERNTMSARVDAFVAKTKEAIQLRMSRPGQWRKLQSAAMGARFTWEESAREYIETMYAPL